MSVDYLTDQLGIMFASINSIINPWIAVSVKQAEIAEKEAKICMSRLQRRNLVADDLLKTIRALTKTGKERDVAIQELIKLGDALVEEDAHSK